jgi:hypothetical protein
VRAAAKTAEWEFKPAAHYNVVYLGKAATESRLTPTTEACGRKEIRAAFIQKTTFCAVRAVEFHSAVLPHPWGTAVRTSPGHHNMSVFVRRPPGSFNCTSPDIGPVPWFR